MPYEKTGAKTGFTPKKEEPFNVQVITRLTQKQSDEVNECVKMAGISKMQWLREAILDRISLTVTHAVPTGRLIDVPVSAEKPRKRKPGYGPITLSGIRAHNRWHSVAPFIEKFIEVCSRHPKLNRSLKRTKDTKVIYFDSYLIETLHDQMKEEVWDEVTLLKALDTLDHYNGKGEWGVASLDWLMTNKRKVGYGWQRILNNYRARAEEESDFEPLTLEKCRPMAEWLAKGQGYVIGSHDANRVLKYVYEKCLAHGFDKVREMAIKNGIGQQPFDNLKKAFRDA